MSAQLIRTLWLATVFTSMLLGAASSRPSPAFDVGGGTASSIYDALVSHGLPMGLLPKGVEDYKLDDEGRFELHLDQACNAEFESELHYDRNVSGRLGHGEIAELAGISARELFLWFPVKAIRVEDPKSGLIRFDVDVVSKQFAASLFETPPDCFAGALPPNLEEGKSIIQTLAKSGDALSIGKNQHEKMRAISDTK